MPSHLSQKKLASVRDAAEYYGVGTSTLWRWLQQGLIPEPVRIGGRTFWEVEVLEQHLSDLRAKATSN